MSSEAPVPRRNADELARQLQSRLRGQRPRPWLIFGALLTAAVLLMTALAWWLYPSAEPPVLAAYAVDTFLTPEQTPQATARLVLVQGEASTAHLEQREIVFLEAQPRAEAKPRESATTSDEAGLVQAAWPLDEAATSAAFLVRYIDKVRRRPSLDQGRIFRWPASSRLLFVDVETLFEPGKDADLAHRKRRPEAVVALRHMAADKGGWHVVYLLARDTTWPTLRKTRDTMERHFAPGSATADGLPLGPVIGLVREGGTLRRLGMSGDFTRDEVSRFQGPHALITADATLADDGQHTLGNDGRIVWLGAEAPPGTTAVAWPQVLSTLTK